MMLKTEAVPHSLGRYPLSVLVNLAIGPISNLFRQPDQIEISMQFDQTTISW